MSNDTEMTKFKGLNLGNLAYSQNSTAPMRLLGLILKLTETAPENAWELEAVLENSPSKTITLASAPTFKTMKEMELGGDSMISILEIPISVYTENGLFHTRSRLTVMMRGDGSGCSMSLMMPQTNILITEPTNPSLKERA